MESFKQFAKTVGIGALKLMLGFALYIALREGVLPDWARILLPVPCVIITLYWLGSIR